VRCAARAGTRYVLGEVADDGRVEQVDGIRNDDSDDDQNENLHSGVRLLDAEPSGDPEYERREQRPNVHLLKREADRDRAWNGAQGKSPLVGQSVRRSQQSQHSPECKHSQQLGAAERLGASGTIDGIAHTFIIRRSRGRLQTIGRELHRQVHQLHFGSPRVATSSPLAHVLLRVQLVTPGATGE